MDTLSVFCLVLATAAACIVALQVYSIYLNYDHIVEFNDAYAGLENVRSLGGLFIDKRVFDPNDAVVDVKQKWRCVERQGKYVSLSAFGFYATENGAIREFPNHDGCVAFTFAGSGHSRIVNPCTSEDAKNSAWCDFLKSAL
uniref:IMV membrane protein n=1 Tax=Rousettus bat poxvirus TaxID=3141933 RepID=A0AAU7E2H7_9POXV